MKIVAERSITSGGCVLSPYQGYKYLLHAMLANESFESSEPETNMRPHIDDG